MLNENAKKWVAALRSGDYKQGKNALCRNDEAFCCLGVACELYQKEVGGLRIGQDGELRKYDGKRLFPPDQVLEWIGLRHIEGKYTLPGDKAGTLASENDSGATFTEIADLIESDPPGLFR